MVEIHVRYCSQNLCGQQTNTGASVIQRARARVSDDEVVIIDDSAPAKERADWSQYRIKSEDGMSCLRFSKNIRAGDGQRAKYRCRETSCINKYHSGLTMHGYKKHVKIFHGYEINLRQFWIKKIEVKNNHRLNKKGLEENKQYNINPGDQANILTLVPTSRPQSRHNSNPSPVSLSCLSWTSDEVINANFRAGKMEIVGVCLRYLLDYITVESDARSSDSLNTPVNSPVTSVARSPRSARSVTTLSTSYSPCHSPKKKFLQRDN